MKYGKAVSEFKDFFSERHETLSEELSGANKIITIDFESLDLFNFELTDHVRKNSDQAVESAKDALSNLEDVEKAQISIEIANMPEEDFVRIKNIGADHIGQLIPIEGLITNIENSEVEIASAIFECEQCGDRYEKKQENGEFESPYKCDCGSRKFDIEEKVYQDTQEFTVSSDIQEIKCRIEGGKLGTREEYLDKELEFYGVVREDNGSLYFEVKGVEELEPREIDWEDEEFLSGLVKESFDIRDIESFLETLDPLKFEKLIAYIFEEAGWRTELTQGSGDKGIDVIARKRFPVKRKYLIQVKYYNKETTSVSPDEVQQYNSLKEQEPNVDQVLLITTSSYTLQAEELAEMLDIKILDRDDVLHMLNSLEEHRDQGVIEVQKGEDENEDEFDLENISTEPTEEDTRVEEIKSTIEELSGPESERVEKEKVLSKLEEEGMDKEQAKDTIENLKRDGELYEPEADTISKI